MERKSWSEFRDSGLLWWINSILHIFGWAIVIEFNDDIKAYPARVKYRGFEEDINTNGYINVTKYMKENCEQLLKEVKEGE